MLLAVVTLPARAEDIVFTYRTATFTNLQGEAYKNVQLVRGDQDGLIWREGASGGRICYTNLAPELLESFGISSNRIAIARDRAEHKAVADARYHALALAEAEAKLRARAQLNRAPLPAPPSVGPAESNGSAGDFGPTVPYGPENGEAYGPGFVYGPGMAYYPGFGYGYPYGPTWFYGPGVAPSAPRAPSAPSALSAPSAPSFRAAPVLRPSSPPPTDRRRP